MIPTRIAGRYEPLAKIAAGGMATVYLARSVGSASFRKLVAIKCVHPHMADQPDFVEMFLDEARIASRIDHPNVCSVFDAGEDEGTHYIAMEYLHGEALSALIRRWDRDPEARPASFAELAARIIADAAMGLHAAHELRGGDGTLLGLVHRDISPQNLFLTYDGSVKVVDFGIAKAAGRLHETTTGVVKGKLAYMSPEQLRAQPLDRRSDVFALGVTLWELLTCHRLFKRPDQIETLNAVLGAEIDPPSDVDPSVPAELDAIVMRALSRDPAHRQESARALADELNDFIASRGVAIGMSQVADLMVATFTDLKADKDLWVQRSLEAKPSERPSASDPPVEPTVSEVRPTAAVVPTEPIELPVKRTAPWLLVAAASLAAAAALGAFVLFDGEPSGRGVPTVAATRDRGAATQSTQAESTQAESTQAEGTAAQPIPSGVDAPEASAIPAPPREPATRAIPDPPGAAAPAPREPARTSRRRAPSPPAEPSPPVAESAGPPPRPAPAAPRALRIVHPGGGWASVRVDGRAYGHTPTTIEGIAPGSHLIELQPYGQGEWSRHPSNVPAGEGAHVLRLRLPDP